MVLHVSAKAVRTLQSICEQAPCGRGAQTGETRRLYRSSEASKPCSHCRRNWDCGALWRDMNGLLARARFLGGRAS